MSSPAIYGGSRTKILTSKGLLLKDGTPIDYNGQKNYITKGTFATNATTGWNLKRTTLSGLIPNQVAASWTTPSVLSVTATSTGALTQAGFSLSLSASGVTTAGDMLVSDSYTIDIEDQAKTLAFKFSYKAYTNPSNLNFSGTSSNTFHVYIYDDANSAWIQPAGCYSTVQSSGVGIATGTFQTPSNMTSFRIAIVSCNASLNTTASGAFTMYFDNFSVGPQITNMGVPVTDWSSANVSWKSSGTQPTLGNGILFARKKRVGDSAKYYIVLIAGTTTNLGSGTYSFELDETINTDKIYGDADRSNFGTVRILDAGAKIIPGFVGFNGSKQVQIRYFTTQPGTNPVPVDNVNLWSSTTPFSFGDGDTITLEFEVPISGWSSNTVMSSDAAVNVVAANATKTTGSHTSTGNFQTVASWTLIRDETGSFNASSGFYTVSVVGWYRVNASITFASNSTGQRYIRINAGGSYYGLAGGQSSAADITALQASQDVYLTAGQQISIEAFQNTGGNLNYAGNGSSLSISRISGPTQIAASETVAASLNWTTGTIGPNNNAVKVPLNSSVFDTHNGFVAASNRWIAPIAGIFDISATINFTSTNVISARYVAGIYNKNGEVLRLNEHTPYSAGVYFSLSGSGLLKLNAGDYIELWVYGAANNSVNQLSTDNATIPTLSIKKIGN